MKVADLSAEAVQQIKSRRFDCLIDKHEGPETWAFFLSDAEFLDIDSHAVLLPIHKEEHPFITIFRCIVSADASILTIFLKDTMYTKVGDANDEMFFAGRIAICERVSGQNFYLATVYHEWYIINDV